MAVNHDIATGQLSSFISYVTQILMSLMMLSMIYVMLTMSSESMKRIVEVLDEKGAILERKNDEIDRIYEDITGKGSDSFDAIIANIPQRMWVE